MKTEEHTELFEDFPGEEGDLIPLLQKVQSRAGYISQDAVKQISRFIKISENRIFGVASFYSQFRFNPPGKHSIKACVGTACHVRGGRMIVDAVASELGILPGETTEDGTFDLQRVACLGCCALAPVVQIDRDIYGHVTTTRLKKILQEYD